MKLHRQPWSEALTQIEQWVKLGPTMAERFQPMLHCAAECLMDEWNGAYDRRTLPELELVVYGPNDEHWGLAHPWPIEMKPRKAILWIDPVA